MSVIGDAGEQLDLLASAFRAALSLGCRCLFIADRTPPQAFIEGMAGRGCDIAEPIAAGQFLVVRADQTYTLGGHFDADRQLGLLGEMLNSSRTDGFTGLCVSGELTWLWRGVPGVDRVLEYEYRINQLDGLESAAFICLYDGCSVPAWMSSELEKVHPFVHTNGEVSASGSFSSGSARAAEVPLAEDLEPAADRLPCHLLVELLSAYADNELAPRRRDELTRHLDTCAECRDTVQMYGALRTSLGAARRPGSAPEAFWEEVRQRLRAGRETE